MTTNKFTAFIDLVQFDQKTSHFRQKIDSLKTELEKLKKEKDQVDMQFENAREQRNVMRKKVDENELKMQELDQQEQQQKKRLDEAKNEKEYRAVKSEIDSLEDKQTELEAQLVGSWHALEQAEKEYNKKKLAVKNELKDLQDAIQEQEKVIKATYEEMEMHIAKRSKKSIAVPQEWLERYSGMAERVSDPVVPVEYDSCSGCFYMIPHEDRVALDNNALLQCKGCYRFLYIPKASSDQPKKLT